MTFDDWWESSPTQQLGESESQQTARRLTARWAWEAGSADASEELLTQFNRTGADIDAALHGRVNEKSPIAGRLRMIAAAQPKWRPIEECKPRNGQRYLVTKDCGPHTIQSVSLAYLDDDEWVRDSDSSDSLEDLGYRVTHLMPMPPLPEPPND